MARDDGLGACAAWLQTYLHGVMVDKKGWYWCVLKHIDLNWFDGLTWRLLTPCLARVEVELGSSRTSCWKTGGGTWKNGSRMLKLFCFSVLFWNFCFCPVFLEKQKEKSIWVCSHFVLTNWGRYVIPAHLLICLLLWFSCPRVAHLFAVLVSLSLENWWAQSLWSKASEPFASPFVCLASLLGCTSLAVG